MEHSGIFPASDVGLVATGERTGNIEEVLGRIADFYHQGANATLARIPVIVRTTLIVLALAIGAVAPFLFFSRYASILTGIMNSD
jgi:type II secretory pathway component PulF